MSVAQVEVEPLNYIGGEWLHSKSPESTKIFDPSNLETLATAAMADGNDVSGAVAAASAAFPEWRRTPAQDRIQYLFKFRNLLLEHAGEIARLTTRENGKTLTEARAELQRGIENVEVACGIPILMQGSSLEDVARGIDEIMIRQPLGVTAAITPFNFPSMIPLWFLPYAIACGNTFILKPSERVPLTACMLMQLLAETGLPKGVVNLLIGGKAVVDGLLHHPDVRAISFVGSTKVAKYVYAEGSAHGKRVQCQGGAKNYVVVMPDADLETSARIISDSAFGCAGQRCLAVSSAITVGDASTRFVDALVDIASKLSVKNGLEEGAQMGPVISPASKSRIEGIIGNSLKKGASAILDGRNPKIQGGEQGAFLKPTILSGVAGDDDIVTTEVFGPVLAVQAADTLDDAIERLSRSAYGNAASIFTSNGNHARKFRYDVAAGNIGVNVGVAAPMAYFPFSGWKDSFLGVVHAQGRDGVEFYTDKKVVIERWPKEWSRKF